MRSFALDETVTFELEEAEECFAEVLSELGENELAQSLPWRKTTRDEESQSGFQIVFSS